MSAEETTGSTLTELKSRLLSFDDAPLLSLPKKQMSEMTEDELRDEVNRIRTWRTSHRPSDELKPVREKKEKKGPKKPPIDLGEYLL